MQQAVTLKVLPQEVENESILRQYAASTLGVKTADITGFYFLKKSIDARSKQVWINCTLNVFVQEPFFKANIETFSFRDVHRATTSVIIIGAGPAGLFAALSLIEAGIKPLILERGKDIRARRRDLAALNKEGVVNPDSNYCFGAGGAGTYSDGKLYTRSKKRGDVKRILELFVQFGADEKILYEAHPHIGTNKLPDIILRMGKQITDCGGELLFGQKVTDLLMDGDRMTGVQTAGGDVFNAAAIVLATGHSARDIFMLLERRKILIELKPFALGVRIEHPQELIDRVQYHRVNRGEFLPPAAYSLVQQVDRRGVFSFCMCPGGIIAPAATNPGELVVNGWSPSKRNNPFANSGMVVSVEKEDLKPLESEFGVLAALQFQRTVEEKAFAYGGGKLVAPAQRMTDMVSGKLSATLPGCSYLPGIRSAPMQEILPPFIFKALRKAFVEFGKKMPGYYTEEAVVVATESRTSSPVRIPRDPATLQHPQVRNLYPCSEGAGYAGGIVSAAMDGENVARAIRETIGR